MKNLILIRHAKSSWDFPMDDKERPLTNNGKLAAKKMAQLSQSFLPKDYQIYCSSARRTSETAIIFSEVTSFPKEAIHFLDELYTFECSQLVKTIQGLTNQVDTVIIFGHNAAITEFVNKFGDQYIENVPTSGFVSMQFESKNWNSISKGKLLKIIVK